MCIFKDGGARGRAGGAREGVGGLIGKGQHFTFRGSVLNPREEKILDNIVKCGALSRSE